MRTFITLIAAIFVVAILVSNQALASVAESEYYLTDEDLGIVPFEGRDNNDEINLIIAAEMGELRNQNFYVGSAIDPALLDHIRNSNQYNLPQIAITAK
jgi:hypothetical protein